MDHLIKETGLPAEEIKPRLYKLEKEGLIKKVKDRQALPRCRAISPQILYTRRVGLKARLNQMVIMPKKRTTSWDKIWKTIRAMRRFTRADLIQLTGTSSDQVKDFTKALERDGYIKKVAWSPGRQAIFNLCKDPGPQRPRISIKR